MTALYIACESIWVHSLEIFHSEWRPCWARLFAICRANLCGRAWSEPDERHSLPERKIEYKHDIGESCQTDERPGTT
jgi:hypothetical protein